MAAGNGKKNGNGNGDTASHTLRLLREMRAQMAQMATKDDLKGLATKTDLARVEARLDKRIDNLETRLGGRIDVLRRVFKENHRVLTKRIGAVETRLGMPGR